MIKIIQVDSCSELGGGQIVMFNIVEELKNKFQFIIIAPPGKFLEKYQKLNLKIYPLLLKNLLKNILRIRQVIKREKPKIIHCHGTRAAFLVRTALIRLKEKPKVLYTLHGFHLPKKHFFVRWFFLILEKILNHWTDLLICVSEADKRLVLKFKTISSRKIKVIKNGIDIEKFRVNLKGIQKIKKELGLMNKFILSSIGRLHPQKDFSTILKALRLLIPNFKNNIKLLIIGDGPQKEFLEKEVKNLKLKEYVKFLGFREDIPLLINLSDIIILSTNWEGLPLIPLETAVCKKPIIASDVNGVRETIIDTMTGYLFKVGSKEDLARKILKLAKSKELRKKIGNKAFEFVSKKFSKEKMIKEYQNLYETFV